MMLNIQEYRSLVIKSFSCEIVTHISLVVGKPVFRVSDQVQHKPGFLSKKMAICLRFRIQEVEELYYPCIGSTGTVFVFVYAKIQFSHNEAYILKERPIM